MGQNFPLNIQGMVLLLTVKFNEIQKLVYANSIATSKNLRAFNFLLELIPLA